MDSITKIDQEQINQDIIRKLFDQKVSVAEQILERWQKEMLNDPEYAEKQKIVVRMLEEYSRVVFKDKWIPVKERLPEDSRTVLVTHKCGVSTAYYNGRYWTRGSASKQGMLRTVTAWMPFPEPYKENVNG